MKTGFIAGLDGKPLKVTFEVRGELAILEGDIVLGRVNQIATSAEQLRAAPPARPGGPDFGAVIIGSSYRWPDGVVPYVIDPTLPNPSRVTSAIEQVESKTFPHGQVDFVPWSGQTNYIRFVPSTGCSSYIGMVGGQQLINLADGCRMGNALHEIAHALGLFHEQSRCDRGAYVEILWANITPGAEHNFESRCNDRTDLFEYAESSIMHYGPLAFSANGQPTIRSLRGFDNLMGQRDSLSNTDLATINRIYPKPAGLWTMRTALPAARRALAIGVASSRVYAIGGLNSAGTVLATVSAYDPNINHWVSRASLPAARQTGNGAATVNGIMYLAGGHDATGALTRTLFAYNAGTNAWSTKATMPAFSSCGGSAAYAGRLYVFSGCTRSSTGKQVPAGLLHRYNPGTNSWTTLRAAPAAHFQPVVGVIGDKLYVVGGNNESGAHTGRVDVYDPATNTWSTTASMPTARVAASGATIGGKLHIVGGRNGTTYLSTVEVYDPSTNSWSKRASMPTARAGFGVGVISGSLYAVGGRNSAAVLPANERFAP